MRRGWVRRRLVVRDRSLRGLVYSRDVSDVQQFDCVIFEQCCDRSLSLFVMPHVRKSLVASLLLSCFAFRIISARWPLRPPLVRCPPLFHYPSFFRDVCRRGCSLSSPVGATFLVSG